MLENQDESGYVTLDHETVMGKIAEHIPDSWEELMIYASRWSRLFKSRANVMTQVAYDTLTGTIDQKAIAEAEGPMDIGSCVVSAGTFHDAHTTAYKVELGAMAANHNDSLWNYTPKTLGAAVSFAYNLGVVIDQMIDYVELVELKECEFIMSNDLEAVRKEVRDAEQPVKLVWEMWIKQCADLHQKATEDAEELALARPAPFDDDDDEIDGGARKDNSFGYDADLIIDPKKPMLEPIPPSIDYASILDAIAEKVPHGPRDAFETCMRIMRHADLTLH